MSFILLGILNSQASAVAQAYFLNVLGGASSDRGKSVAIDSADNVYSVGATQSTGAGGVDFLLAKYDNSGVIQFQRALGGASADEPFSVAIDSADNAYLVGVSESTGAGAEDLLLAKYNSAGAIQFQRSLGIATNDNGRSVAIDSADNVYVLGRTIVSGFAFLFAKYNSSGTVQFQRTLSGGGSENGFAIAIDSADNAYLLGSTSSAGGVNDHFLFAKYNSSGTIQFQRFLVGSGFEIPAAIAIDSADNAYLVGFTTSAGAGGTDLLIAKYNSSGTIQWQRVLGGGSGDQGQSVAIDSADNVYVLGRTLSTGAGSNDFLLAKYDSSGTIQFQRVLGGTKSDIGFGIGLDSLDNLYLLGQTNSTGAGNFDFLLAKLPNDGSLEGTYSLDGNNITYAASSLTAATSSLTSSTSSLTAATPSLTSSTSSLTDAASALTSVTLEIG